MQPDKWIGQMRGIVQTIEQKSGLNAVLFVIALISLPSLFLYAYTNKGVFLLFVSIPLALFIIIYIIAFIIDRNFLRSEKFVYDMKKLEFLGEKGKEINERTVLDIPPTTDPSSRVPKKIKQGK